MGRWYFLPPRVLQTLAWGPVRCLLIIFCHFRVRGSFHLQTLPKAIFAVNHTSELDPIILTSSLSPLGRFAPMFYVLAPHDEFKDRRFGWRQHIYSPLFFKAWGAFPIARGQQNYETALQIHVEILRRGGSICIFPEGSKSRDGLLKEGHGGVAYLSYASSVPVVPVAISGSYKLGIRAFLSYSRRLTITFGEPFYPAQFFSDSSAPTVTDYKRAAHAIMGCIGDSLSTH